MTLQNFQELSKKFVFTIKNLANFQWQWNDLYWYWTSNNKCWFMEFFLNVNFREVVNLTYDILSLWKILFCSFVKQLYKCCAKCRIISCTQQLTSAIITCGAPQGTPVHYSNNDYLITCITGTELINPWTDDAVDQRKLGHFTETFLTVVLGLNWILIFIHKHATEGQHPQIIKPCEIT